jgi:serine/threonine protein kinase
MDESWKRVDALLQSALDRPRAERDAFLRDACGGNATLEREVRSLLDSYEHAGPFLERPAIELEQDADPLVGRDVSHYRIVERLGGGGMGVVYRAQDQRLNRFVALKFLANEFAGDPEYIGRFRREAQAASALNHPNICTIYDVGNSDGHPFLVMEHLEGATLKERLADTRLTPDRVVTLGLEILDGLEAAHNAGIVHRDIKPANIFITSGDHAKILDFGLAKASGVAAGAVAAALDDTRVGAVLGTAAYMAPEQARGEEVDHRTDLWAFGIVLYEMFTGARPIAGIGPSADVPAPFASVIARCLEPDRERRYQNAGEVRAAITEVAGFQEPRRSRWRGSALYVSAAVILIAAIAGIALRNLGTGRRPVAYEQLTSFSDAAFEPALSPDERMMAFLVGSDTGFPPTGDIYTVMLPNGEPIRRTYDGRVKYGVAFSSDGSQITYTVGEGGRWNTMSLPVAGGEPRILLLNAAGLTWLDAHHLLFSQIRTGLHMELVTATDRRESSRSVYLPRHERGMAHYGYLSPDRKSVLIVEMGPAGPFVRCRLAPFDGHSEGSQVGPEGRCTSAAWSADGRWMYFTAVVDGASHVWREPFPSGALEQITSGPTQERGLAMSADGRSLVTALGILESGIWMHTPQGERVLSADGYASSLSFSRDGRFLFYMLRRATTDTSAELWQTDLSSGKGEPLVRGFSIASYSVSLDGTQILFAVRPERGPAEIWLTSRNGTVQPRMLTSSGEDEPMFGPAGEVVFRQSEDHNNYLFVMNADGSNRRKVTPTPITEIRGMSADRRVAVAMTPLVTETPATAVLAVPLYGGPVRRVCPVSCMVKWSPDGARMYVRLLPRAGSRNTIVIPVPDGESMAELPASGVQSEEDAKRIPGSELVDFTPFPSGNSNDVAPGPAIGTFAYARTISHRNLFRVQLP